MRNLEQWVAMLAAVIVVAGCGHELHPAWGEPMEPDGPVQMEEAVVYLDREFEDVVTVRSSIEDGEPALSVDRTGAGANPATMAASYDKRSLYVINRGERNGQESMSIFDVGDDDVERSDIELGSFYDTITVDPEGDFVLLSNTGDEEVISQNLQELGIIDLRGDEPQYRVTTLNIRTDQLELLPSFEIAGQTARLAVVTATNNVGIVDLDAEEQSRDQFRRVPLTTTAVDERIPRQVVFDPPSADASNPSGAKLFVLDDTSDVVTQISMDPAIDEDSSHRLDLSASQLAAGQQPAAIDVLDIEGVGKRLLVLDGQLPQFSLVDVSSNEWATFDLPTGAPASGMETYSVVVDDNGESRHEQRVLAYSTNSEIAAVIRPETINLGSDVPTLGRAVESIRLQASPSKVLMDEHGESNQAVILHRGGNDGFSVLNLERNSTIAWTGRNLSEVVFDGGMAYGIYGDTPHMERFNPQTGASRTFELADFGQELFWDADGQTLMIRHRGSGGRFTVFPRDEFLNDDGRLFEQVFLEGLLGRTDVDDDQ